MQQRHGTVPVRVGVVLAGGVSEGQLRAAVRAGALLSVGRGMVCVPAALDPLDGYARAAGGAQRRMNSDAVASHSSAGTLLRLPTPCPADPIPDELVVTAPVSGRRVDGRRVVRGYVPDEDRVVVRGVVCTSVERTALDLARGRPLSESLVVLDAALRRLVLADTDVPQGPAWRRAEDQGATDRARARLLACFDRLAPTWHATGLRAAIWTADPRAETPLESASRGVLLQAQLPPPDLQVWVRGDDGRWYRCDMGWREHGMLGEADGRVKYTDPDVLWEEKRRQDAILATGEWRSLVRWVAYDVWRDPARLVERVSRALG